MAGRPLVYSVMPWAVDLKGTVIKKKNTPKDLCTLGTSVIYRSPLIEVEVGGDASKRLAVLRGF